MESRAYGMARLLTRNQCSWPSRASRQVMLVSVLFSLGWRGFFTQKRPGGGDPGGDRFGLWCVLTTECRLPRRHIVLRRSGRRLCNPISARIRTNAPEKPERTCSVAPECNYQEVMMPLSCGPQLKSLCGPC